MTGENIDISVRCLLKKRSTEAASAVDLSGRLVITDGDALKKTIPSDYHKIIDCLVLLLWKEIEPQI